MSTKKPQAIPATDRSMNPDKSDGQQVFFFPKRNPPVSVRAASLEEAEALLATPNSKEHE